MKGTTVNQSELVINYLKRNSRRKLTSEQVCEGVNKMLKTKYPNLKRTFTPTQISKCLSRFSALNIVSIDNDKGETTNGHTVNRWAYVTK